MLTLTIKKKWFDMILSGEKKEEYREIKRYYTVRFEKYLGSYKGYKQTFEVRFRNGYDINSPSFVARCIVFRSTGRPEWGAEPEKMYYVLRILEVGPDR